jgi:3-oxoacyl-[acyl-carrier protein] reductase
MKSPVALVTGASRGIGKAIALTLAHKGYDLILTASTNGTALQEVAHEIKALGRRCLWQLSDSSSYEATEQLFNGISAFSPTLDLVVNNAGISYIGLMTDMSVDQWHQLLNTNLSSVFYTSKFCVPMMVAQKNGCIINISSIWGEQGASCEVAYSASKGGLNSFTKALSKELAPSSIRVNAIACGVIDTDMNAWLDSGDRDDLINDIGLGRIGNPQDIADAVVFLASPKASYLTGQIITIDGGL